MVGEVRGAKLEVCVGSENRHVLQGLDNNNLFQKKKNHNWLRDFLGKLPILELLIGNKIW